MLHIQKLHFKDILARPTEVCFATLSYILLCNQIQFIDPLSGLISFDRQLSIKEVLA